MLSEALTNAEQRVAALNEQLGEKAEEAARNAIGQFETMRLAAVAEGQRAVEGVQTARLSLEAKVREATNASGAELRAAAGGLVNEVSEAVAEATRRFAKTADDLRGAAQEMQRELTQTRDELQKGVLEMPAEAIEASSAMRRAIAEQIEAINELTKIVARSAGETIRRSRRRGPAMPPAAGPCRSASRARARRNRRRRRQSPLRPDAVRSRSAGRRAQCRPMPKAGRRGACTCGGARRHKPRAAATARRAAGWPTS